MGIETLIAKVENPQDCQKRTSDCLDKMLSSLRNLEDKFTRVVNTFRGDVPSEVQEKPLSLPEIGGGLIGQLTYCADLLESSVRRMSNEIDRLEE